MSEQALSLVDAIQLAMEAEKQAVTVYKDAAQKTASMVIERLFNSLADFEQHHYDKLTELAASLQKKGQVHRLRRLFYSYPGTERDQDF